MEGLRCPRKKWVSHRCVFVLNVCTEVDGVYNALDNIKQRNNNYRRCSREIFAARKAYVGRILAGNFIAIIYQPAWHVFSVEHPR